MKAGLVRQHVNCLMGYFLAEARQPELLKPVLHKRYVDIRQWPRREIQLIAKWPHQQRREKHFVVGEHARHLRAQGDQCVGQIRQRLARVAENASIKPRRWLLEWDDIHVAYPAALPTTLAGWHVVAI